MIALAATRFMLTDKMQVCSALCIDITGELPLPPPPLPSHASSQGGGGAHSLEQKWSGRCTQRDFLFTEEV